MPSGPQGACNAAALQVGWTSLNNGYVVTQFYHGLPYPDGKRYLGGIQDKGSLRGSDAGGINGWRQIANSDGGHNANDPNDPNTIYIYLLKWRATFSSPTRKTIACARSRPAE